MLSVEPFTSQNLKIDLTKWLCKSSILIGGLAVRCKNPHVQYWDRGSDFPYSGRPVSWMLNIVLTSENFKTVIKM